MKSQNILSFSIIAILLIGLGAMVYLWTNKRSELHACQNDNLVLKSDMQYLSKMMEGYTGGLSKDLKSDFKTMLETYDKLIEMDRSKADSLNKQKEHISVLLQKLNSQKPLTPKELIELKKENEVLRAIMRGYVVQIDSLNTLNIKLSSSLDETSTRLTATTTERDAYKKESEEKSVQLKKGAKLQAYGFTSQALRMKVNNTTTETEKAKNAIQLRSTFTIGENTIASPGKKSVYLQIIAPSGDVLHNKPNTKMETEAGQLFYSDKKDIDYNNQAIDLTIYYDLKGQELTRGNYKVKIYCEGLVIGTDSFTLK